jgi:hypothetical protein
MALRSCVLPANRDAAKLERTTSDFSAESEVVNASGRLKAKKSVSGSGRSMRNGKMIRRMTGFGSKGTEVSTGTRKR